MFHFPNLERILFISHCSIFIFYKTWYNFPNLHILYLDRQNEGHFATIEIYR